MVGICVTLDMSWEEGDKRVCRPSCRQALAAFYDALE
jgi:hypothetical protein